MHSEFRVMKAMGKKILNTNHQDIISYIENTNTFGGFFFFFKQEQSGWG